MRTSFTTGLRRLSVYAQHLRWRLVDGRRRAGYRLATVTVLPGLLLSTGCAPTIRFDNTFPSPAVDAVPLSAAVYYSEDFEDYTYTAPSGADAAVVELGPAQVHLLDRLLGAMFVEYSRLASWPAGNANSGPDLVIAPSITRFTMHGPAYLGSGYYEVQITYRLDLYSSAGELVGVLPVEGYGRSPATWSSLSEPIRKATVGAMRDAAVQIVLQLAEQPAIDRLLRDEPSTDHGPDAT